jgi:hypothetical protein
MSLDQAVWLPLCAGLTGVGLVLSFLLLRRRGIAAGLRGAAWSLLPLAAYLTGALPTVWQIGTSIGGFFGGLAFSPKVWAGVAVTGLAVVLFLVSGLLRGRRRAAAPAAPASETPATGSSAGRGKPLAPGEPAQRQQSPQRKAAPVAKPAAKPAADDDFSDVEDILKRHGIG